ncbi:hypothetical protein OHT21_26200 [Streptomyces sp. NBC_00286]|nr:hypothetical protein [Streptomyces sp. NBC_00286]
MPRELVHDRIEVVGAARVRPCVRLSPKSNVLAVAGEGTTVNLYDLAPREWVPTRTMGSLRRHDLAEVTRLQRYPGLGHTARQALDLLSACLIHRFQHDYAIRHVNWDTGAYEFEALVEAGTAYPTEDPVKTLTVKAVHEGQRRLGLGVYELAHATYRDAGADLEIAFDAGGGARTVAVTPSNANNAPCSGSTRTAPRSWRPTLRPGAGQPGSRAPNSSGRRSGNWRAPAAEYCQTSA